MPSNWEGRVAPIHRTNTRATARIINDPVNTPIWPDRNWPTCGTQEDASGDAVEDFGGDQDEPDEEGFANHAALSSFVWHSDQNVSTFQGPFSLSVSGCPIPFTSMSSFFKASTTP